MRIESNVEFVKQECEKHHPKYGWDDHLATLCGREVESADVDEDGDYSVSFAGEQMKWLFPASCIEGVTSRGASLRPFLRQTSVSGHVASNLATCYTRVVVKESSF